MREPTPAHIHQGLQAGKQTGGEQYALEVRFAMLQWVEASYTRLRCSASLLFAKLAQQNCTGDLLCSA